MCTYICGEYGPLIQATTITDLDLSLQRTGSSLVLPELNLFTWHSLYTWWLFFLHDSVSCLTTLSRKPLPKSPKVCCCALNFFLFFYVLIYCLCEFFGLAESMCEFYSDVFAFHRKENSQQRFKSIHRPKGLQLSSRLSRQRVHFVTRGADLCTSCVGTDVWVGMSYFQMFSSHLLWLMNWCQCCYSWRL